MATHCFHTVVVKKKEDLPRKKRCWQYWTIYQCRHKEAELLKDLQSLGNSALDVDGWNLAFPFCQSCWVDKCFIHEAQGRKGCQRFKNILRNSLRHQASCQEALRKDAEVLHQPSWAINPLQRLEVMPVVLGSHSLSLCACCIYFALTCIHGQSSKR